MNFSRSGWMAPVSSVARDFSTVALPSQDQGHRKRVSARGRTGVCSGALIQVLPPSALISTFVIVPSPDHASPVIW